MSQRPTIKRATATTAARRPGGRREEQRDERISGTPITRTRAAPRAVTARGRLSSADERAAEAERGEQARGPTPAPIRRRACRRLPLDRGSSARHADDREGRHPRVGQRYGRSPRPSPYNERHNRARRAERPDDLPSRRPRARGRRRDTTRPRSRPRRPPGSAPIARRAPTPSDGHDEREDHEAAPLRAAITAARREPPRGDPPRSPRRPTRELAREREQDCRSIVDGARRGDGVELVRVVEHRRLRRAGGANVVVRRRPRAAAPPAAAGRAPSARSSISRSPRCTWPSSRPSSVGRKRRAAAELDACGRRRARAPPRAAGRRAAADAAAPSRGRASRRRRCARAARRRRSGGRRASPGARAAARGLRVRHAPDGARSPGWWISATRNSRKPSSSSASRRIAGASAAGRRPARLERAHVELQPVAELLDAAEHAHRVALAEARVEQLDVVPDARLDAAARVDELEREVRRAAFRPQALLPRDGVDALDGAVLRELGDRRHDRRV